jgi:hypothetical protein
MGNGQFEMSIDADVIAQVAAAGADLSVPHTIPHYIYVPNRESADSIANELRQRASALKNVLARTT